MTSSGQRKRGAELCLGQPIGQVSAATLVEIFQATVDEAELLKSRREALTDASYEAAIHETDELQRNGLAAYKRFRQRTQIIRDELKEVEERLDALRPGKWRGHHDFLGELEPESGLALRCSIWIAVSNEFLLIHFRLRMQATRSHRNTTIFIPIASGNCQMVSCPWSHLSRRASRCRFHTRGSFRGQQK